MLVYYLQHLLHRISYGTWLKLPESRISGGGDFGKDLSFIRTKRVYFVLGQFNLFVRRASLIVGGVLAGT